MSSPSKSSSVAPSRPTQSLTLARSFRFDAEPEPDFSDSEPGNDVDALRAFNQEVLDDARDEDMSEQSELVPITNDAVNLQKQHNAAEDKLHQEDELDESDLIDDAMQPEPEEGAMADEEDEGAPAVLPAHPVKKLVKKAVKKTTKSPAKKPLKAPAKTPAKTPAKATTTTPAKSATKVPVRRARQPKRELPAEKPTRISDRVSKPRARAATQTKIEPKPATTASKKKSASKSATKSKTSGQEWEIESIVGSMIDESHQHFYHVKWKGYSQKENTWEPKINLANAQAAVRAFEAGKPKSTRSKRK